jgi:hypothetical protein
MEAITDDVVLHVMGFLGMRACGELARTCRHMARLASYGGLRRMLHPPQLPREDLVGWHHETTLHPLRVMACIRAMYLESKDEPTRALLVELRSRVAYFQGSYGGRFRLTPPDVARDLATAILTLQSRAARGVYHDYTLPCFPGAGVRLALSIFPEGDPSLAVLGAWRAQVCRVKLMLERTLAAQNCKALGWLVRPAAPRCTCQPYLACRLALEGPCGAVLW